MPPHSDKEFLGAVKSKESRKGVRNRFLRRFRDLETERLFTAPTGFMPRKLRATFISAVGDLNAEAKIDLDSDTLRFYVGQKPTSVLTAHYDVPSIERLGKIAGLAENLATNR